MPFNCSFSSKKKIGVICEVFAVHYVYVMKLSSVLISAAADAVNAVVAAARPKPKLLTAKQRLGKIMGLKGGGSRWKV